MFLIWAQCKEIDGILSGEGFLLSVVWFHLFDFKIQMSQLLGSDSHLLMAKN